MIATSPIDVLRFMAAQGAGAVLVTLVGIEGSSSRALGTQMAVAADGRSIGSFSGGCIEAAVVAEALDVLAEGVTRTVRYGSGSPYIDIRLPCGGGIDLMFVPRPDPAAVAEALRLVEARQPAALLLGAGGAALDRRPEPGGWDGDRFAAAYPPALRIVALGQGEDLTAFARIAHRFGAEVLALTPDAAAVELLAHEDIEARMLASRSASLDLATDPWTAFAFLFHDRDWEEFLLPQALALPGFYHGAIGSARTHHARRTAMAAAGVPPERLALLRGQIGTIPSTRDPGTLALSVLGEIVADYNALAGRVELRTGQAARLPA